MARPASDDIPPIRTAPPPSPEQWVSVARPASPPMYPVRVSEIIALVAVVLVCDVTLYHGHGYSGIAAAFCLVPPLLWFASPQRKRNSASWMTGAMILAASVKLVWSGSLLLVTCGSCILVGFAMTLAGLVPYPIETLVFGSQTVLAGYEGLHQIGRWLIGQRTSIEGISRFRWINIVLPAATFLVFGGVFILANPDLLATFSESLERVSEWIRVRLLDYVPRPLEWMFWLGVFWISIGLVRPVMRKQAAGDSLEQAPQSKLAAPAPLFAAFRNTLLTVILLFATYLAFEFATLWFRELPEGFYYSGYAHEGAAWLTLALALATATLSLIFRGSILRDKRLKNLRRLAWIWSLQNLLLAVAVFHRLFIYVGFNGMSRMRIVGLFGISAVVVGFALVLLKIGQEKNFIWLIRRQLWALGATIFVFSLLPIDVLVVRYNVNRILQGDPAPAVQISVQTIGAEGIAGLLPLIECENPLIRSGVQAMLAGRYEAALAEEPKRKQRGWTAAQWSDTSALNHLRQNKSGFWADYQDVAQRNAAKQAFDAYVYQWY